MLDINGSFLVVFAIVWILVFVLTRIFFNPVRSIRGQRDGVIRDNRSAAGQSLEAYERGVQKVEQSLKAAKAQAEEIRSGLAAEAQQEKTRMLVELGAEFRGQVEGAKAEIARNMAKLKDDMDSHVETIAAKVEQGLMK